MVYKTATPSRTLSHWSADFETITDPADCRVWAWGLCNVDTNQFEYGTDIGSFAKRASKMNSHIYFHNLQFDGSFLVDWLLRNGYSHVDKYARKGEFETLIDGMGKWYSVSVKWMNGNRTQFRDSFKKLPMSVQHVAKSFGLEESKGEIDYHEYRAPGHELTSEELEYLMLDCQIVAKALRQQMGQGMSRLTVGSDAMNEYRSIMGKASFTRMFPVLDVDFDKDIRSAYRGGFTYVNPRFQGVILEKRGCVYDVNSLYPHVMKTRLLPWGMPEKVSGKPDLTDEFPLAVMSITFTAKLKPNHIPCIQIKNSPYFAGTVYQTNIDEPTTMFCTNVDIDLWQQHYDMDILSYNGGFRFNGAHGMFDQFVDKWSEVKERSVGGLRTIAKLFLNSLYGKFGTNPSITSKIPRYDSDSDTVKLVAGDDETRNPIYTAVAVFVTAYARDITIKASQQNYDNFAYADTDSMHLVTTDEPVGIDVHPTVMGSWKHELTFDAAIFARAKCYSERVDDEYQTHVAGLPKQIADKVTFDDFINETVFWGKLVPKRVPGGVVLQETSFSLSLEKAASQT